MVLVVIGENGAPLHHSVAECVCVCVCVCACVRARAPVNDNEYNVPGTKPRNSHLFLHSRTLSLAADERVVKCNV